MASGLLSGNKVLVAWPESSDDWHVWERPMGTARAIAEAIMSGLGANATEQEMKGGRVQYGRRAGAGR